MTVFQRLLLSSLGLWALVMGLSGCQTQSSKSQTSFKTAQTSSQHYHAAKPDAAVKGSSTQHFKQDFKPTQAQTKSSRYVASGNLTKRGQYTYDNVGTKLSLNRIRHPQATLKSGGFTYKVTTVRLIKNVAKTTAARKMAAQALNLKTLKSPYYTLQIKFTVTNHRQQDLTTDGIQAIQLDNRHQLNATNQLSDASAGKTIPANSRLKTYATGLASQKTPPTFKQIKIAFAGAYTAQQKRLIRPSNWLTLPLT